MELSDAQKREFNSHVLMAKDLFSKQEYHKALKHYQQANQLCRSDRLEAKISKLMVCLYYYVLIWLYTSLHKLIYAFCLSDKVDIAGPYITFRCTNGDFYVAFGFSMGLALMVWVGDGLLKNVLYFFLVRFRLKISNPALNLLDYRQW